MWNFKFNSQQTVSANDSRERLLIRFSGDVCCLVRSFSSHHCLARVLVVFFYHESLP